MARQTAALYGFNRGLVSRLALARTDLQRMALSASTQTNWMPRVLGSMMLRPGLEYKGSTRSNAYARHIPFIKSTTMTDDQALIELTDSAMRVRVDEEVVARPAVSTAIRGGDFSADVTHWNKQTNPVSLPQGDGQCVAWSPDGTLLAVGDATTAFLRVYSVSGSTFTALSFPSSALPGQVNGAAFSTDGQFFGIAFADASGSPKYFRVYAVSGTGSSATFTALSNPATLPTGTGNAIAFSVNSGSVAVAHTTSPYVSIYTITGTGASATLAKIADPATLPASTGRGVTYSGDGRFLAVAHDTTPFVTIYSMSGTTYTKISDPGTLPAAAGFGVTFSRSVEYLAVAHTTTPFVTVYAISGTTFTKLTNPVSLPGGNGKGVGFSTDNQYLSVAHATTPFVTNYNLTGTGSATLLVKETNPGTLPAAQGNGARFSPDNRWLAVAHTTTPFVTIYEAYQWLDLDGSGSASTYGGSSSSGIAAGPVSLPSFGSGGAGLTCRQVITAGQILISGSAINITFESFAAVPFTIAKCYVGKAASSGDAWDFSTSPTQVTFNSGSPGFSIAGGSTITSDNISFNLEAGADLVISFYITTNGVAYSGATTGWHAYFNFGGDDASTVDATSYSAAGADALSVKSVAVVGSATPGDYLSLVGTGYTAAKRTQAVAVAAADEALEHGLAIAVARGTVTLKVGTSFGADDLISAAALSEGRHSLAFTPNASLFFVEVSSTTKYATLLDSVQIESVGDMVLNTPWTMNDLAQVRWQQSGDVIFCARYGLQQRRIERRSARSWSIVKYYANDGPFRVENTDDLVSMTASALFGDITVTASLPFFKSTQVGGIMRLTSSGQSVSTNVTGAGQWTNPIKVTGVGDTRAITVTRTGTFSGTVTLQKSLSAPGNWVDVTTYTTAAASPYNDTLDNQTVYYRVGIDTGDYTSGSVVVRLDYDQGQIKGVVRFTGYTSTTVMSAIVLSDLGGTDATEVWEEGMWSDYRGWPSAVTIYEGRLNWDGLDKIVLSVSDAYDSFAPRLDTGDVGDSSAINRSLGYGPTDRIQWALPLGRLAIGTDGGEWSARSNSLDEPLTPDNFNLKNPSTQGSSAVAAKKIDDQGIFIDRTGGRAYGLAMDPDVYDFKSRELSVIVPDLMGIGVTVMDVQRKPDTRIHFVLNDGTVAVLVFDDAEDVKCWVMVETDGIIEDVVVIPGTPEDAVYYVVNRTINSASVRYLERWADEADCRGSTVNKQADAFLEFTQASSATVTGLTHLIGESVVCWANGKCMADASGNIATFVVDGSGHITLTHRGVSFPATSGVVGLTYTAPFVSTKLAYAAQRGTALTQRHKINNLGLILADTHAQGLKYGDRLTAAYLHSLPLMEAGKAVDQDYVWSEYDEPMFSLDGEWGTDRRLCLQAQAPRPCTILAAILDVTTSEGA